jgi:uncharacterized metal-binding protein
VRPPSLLPWKCERCGGIFRLWNAARIVYECDGCGEAGNLAKWAAVKLGLPA